MVAHTVSYATHMHTSMTFINVDQNIPSKEFIIARNTPAYKTCCTMCNVFILHTVDEYRNKSGMPSNSLSDQNKRFIAMPFE